MLQSNQNKFKGSPGAGVSLLLHHHGDQPIMGSGSIRRAFCDILGPQIFYVKIQEAGFCKYYICNFRLSPGTDVEVNVVPQVTLTTEDAINKFSPTDRGCYACHEAKFRFMPSDPGKCLSQFIFFIYKDYRCKQDNKKYINHLRPGTDRKYAACSITLHASI